MDAVLAYIRARLSERGTALGAGFLAATLLGTGPADLERLAAALHQVADVLGQLAPLVGPFVAGAAVLLPSPGKKD